MTGQPAADTEAIRALVREVLADLLPAAAPDPGKPYGTGGSDLAGPSWVPVQEGLPHTVREHVESVEVVSIRTDADLGNFVLHLLHLFEMVLVHRFFLGRFPRRIFCGARLRIPYACKYVASYRSLPSANSNKKTHQWGTSLVLLHAIVKGQVQGVGFRYWLMGEARRLGVKGWVRNAGDGNVEVEAEGTGTRLVAFDVLGSGVGERVLVAQGSVAAAWFPGKPPPIDALIIGSIDEPAGMSAAGGTDKKRGKADGG